MIHLVAKDIKNMVVFILWELSVFLLKVESLSLSVCFIKDLFIKNSMKL